MQTRTRGLTLAALAPTALARTALARTALALAAVLVASGCATADPLTDDDRRALGELAVIAPADSEVEGAVGQVECWQPSASLVDEQHFRVLCRVHYEQVGESRYRDMICIGELEREPVADHCYRWAYYTDMPVFEDRPAYRA